MEWQTSYSGGAMLSDSQRSSRPLELETRSSGGLMCQLKQPRKTVSQYRNLGTNTLVEYRPHSHHWQVMKPIRENNPTESSTTEIDGQKVCNFMTTWGNGLFQVYRDVDGSGELVQIRIKMETMPTASRN